MDQESPKDKLLEACGVPRSRLPSKADTDHESKEHLDSQLTPAQAASVRVQQAQDESDKNYRRLNAYIRDELPAHLVQAFENVAQNQIAASLRPLDDSVHNAACRIESCAEELVGISWNGRLIWLAVLIGVATASVGGCMVRCTFFDDKIDEAKRYEVYGRKVEANIERYKPKDKERLYKYVGGRP